MSNVVVNTPEGQGKVVSYISIIDAKGERVARMLVLLANGVTRWFRELEAVPA